MSSLGGVSSFGSLGMGSGGNHGGSAASFHQPAEKNQIKLFVGGLAFHTHENDLNKYFSVFGRVDNTIVMRDKETQRGRGFGFVLITFKDEDEANLLKKKIIMQNQQEGHYILDKKVDVKSAEDNQGGLARAGHNSVAVTTSAVVLTTVRIFRMEVEITDRRSILHRTGSRSKNPTRML